MKGCQRGGGEEHASGEGVKEMTEGRSDGGRG